MTFLGRLLQVRIERGRATYTLVRGPAITFEHHGQEVRLSPRRPAARAIPEISPPEAPKQPPGRAPARRGVEEPKALSAARKARGRARSAPPST